MAIFDFLRRKAPQVPAESPAKEVTPDDEKSVRVLRGGYGYGQSILRDILGGYGSPRYPDPRELLGDSRAIVRFIPELAAGIDIHKQVMGCVVRLDTEDERFATAFDEWRQSLMWCGESDYAFSGRRGLDTLTAQIALDTMIDGMSFVRAIDRNGDDALRRSQPIDRIRLHDAERFEFAEVETDKHWLYYTTKGVQQQDVRETIALKAVVFHRLPRFPWGAQVTYNSLAASKSALEDEASQNAALKLVSKAPMVTMISGKAEPGLLENDTQLWTAEQKAIKAELDKMLTNLPAGMKTAMANGTRHHEFLATTAEVGVETVSLSEGVQLNTKYADDMRRIKSSVVLGAYIMPTLVNLGEQAGGIGSELFEVAARVMMGYGIGLRDAVWQVIRHFFELHCERNSILIPRGYKPVWDGLVLTEDNAKLKADESRARIAKLHAENMAMIYEAFGRTAANTYAEMHQLTYTAP